MATRQASYGMVAQTYRVCAWCGKEIVGREFDRHHWLVKRSELPKKRFPEIDVIINVVPLHQKCHRQHGQEKEMTKRCHRLVRSIFGQDAIDQFKSRRMK